MEICRACNNLTSSFSSLFSPDTKELFEKCSYLNIELGDTLPTCICNLCLDKCTNWQEFKKMCQKNDTIQRQQLLKPETPTRISEKTLNTNEMISSLNDMDNILIDEHFELLDENFVEEEESISANLIISDDAMETITLVEPVEPINKIELIECHESIGNEATSDLESEIGSDKEDEAEIATQFKCYQCKTKHQTIISLRKHLIDIHFTPSSQVIVKPKRIRKRPTVNKPIVNDVNKSQQSFDEKDSAQSTRQENAVNPVEVAVAVAMNDKKKELIRNYKCRKCPRMFCSSSSRLKHEQSHGEKTRMCSYCGQGFYNTYSLNLHIRVHTNERPHKCKYCPMAFKRTSNLIVHRRRHTNERPYKCDLCPNAYTNNQSLKLHYRMHNNNEELLCSCDICGMKFKNIRFVNAHKRCTHNISIQTQTFPQKCEYCPKIFNFASTLAVHTRIHRNELPYCCKICQKKFRQVQHLTTHIQRVHKLTREEYKDYECNSLLIE